MGVAGPLVCLCVVPSIIMRGEREEGRIRKEVGKREEGEGEG